MRYIITQMSGREETPGAYRRCTQGLYLLTLLFVLSFAIPVDAQRQQAATQNNRSPQPRQAYAQQGQTNVSQRNRVQYIRHFMKQEGDSLVISMDIDMTNLDLRTNHAQIITPVIGTDREEIELPSVMIQGTARNKAYIRELELNDQAYADFINNPPYDIVKPKGRLNYIFAVPFEPWMTEAFLDVEEDLCGCGEQTKIARSRIFDGMTKEVIAEPVYRVHPQLAYIQPAVEPVKHRQEIGNAYLDFPRGNHEIIANFRNNPVELAKIDKMIRTIATNKDITVQRVYMVGYASPESSVKFNTELSHDRAEALMRYFRNNSSIPSSMFEARTGGEDWNGLRALLEDFPIPNKSEIFHIMNTVGDLDAREKALTQLAGGRPWKIMFDELFPKLRRVVCEVNYTVKDFSLEEAIENIAIAPQLLSLNEMYIVANTYAVGSPQFLKVFEVARSEFPQDPTANLNGAAVALARNNLRDAERFLKLSDPSTPEYANNAGVFFLLTGKYREAEQMLRRAESAGIREASANLKELQKKMANVNNRREAGVDEEEDNMPDSPSGGSTRRRVR